MSLAARCNKESARLSVAVTSAACTALTSSDARLVSFFSASSVRMGMSRGSCESWLMESCTGRIIQLMRLYREFQFAIGLESLAAQAAPLVVGVDDFGHSREPVQPGGQARAHVHQQGGGSHGGQILRQLARPSAPRA